MFNTGTDNAHNDSSDAVVFVVVLGLQLQSSGKNVRGCDCSPPSATENSLANKAHVHC